MGQLQHDFAPRLATDTDLTSAASLFLLALLVTLCLGSSWIIFSLVLVRKVPGGRMWNAGLLPVNLTVRPVACCLFLNKTIPGAETSLLWFPLRSCVKFCNGAVNSNDPCATHRQSGSDPNIKTRFTSLLLFKCLMNEDC